MPARRPLLLALALVATLTAFAAWLVRAAFLGIGPATEDAQVLGDAIDVRSGPLTLAAVALTTLGSTLAMALLAVVVGALLWLRGRRADAVYLVATMASTALVFTLVKRLLDRPRPPVESRLVQATNESLPSGHAAMSVAVAGALVVLAWPSLGRAMRAVAVAAAALWALCIGLTRIYLGVHWFSDVVAGWATGAACLAAGTTLLLWHRARVSAAQHPP